MKKILAITVLYMAAAYACVAQSGGINQVISIEAKAKQYQNNVQRIATLKAELATMEEQQRQKIATLNKEIDALAVERDKMIDDMRKGARCSQCKRWKTEIEKEGINFEKHLGDVKGYAIPATTAELDAVRKEYNSKIAVKKVQLQKLEKNTDIQKKREELRTLENSNRQVCSETLALVKQYETNAFNAAAKIHNDRISTLTDYLTNMLIAGDRVVIGRQKIELYKKECADKISKEKEQLKQQTERKKERIGYDLKNNRNALSGIDALQKKELDGLELERNRIEGLKAQLTVELSKSNISDSLRTVLERDRQDYIDQIAQLEQVAENTRQFMLNEEKRVKGIIKGLEDDIAKLNADLPKLQAQKAAEIQAEYDGKIAVVQESITKNQAAEQQYKGVYTEKYNEFDAQNKALLDVVVKENVRMESAGKLMGCVTYNEGANMIHRNWNDVTACISNVATKAKTSMNSVFNSYCKDISSPSYFSAYKRFLNGLSSQDKEAVRQITNPTWFQELTKR